MRVILAASVLLLAGCLEPTSDDPGVAPGTDDAPEDPTPITSTPPTSATPTSPSPPATGTPAGPMVVTFRSLADGQQEGPESPQRESYHNAVEWGLASQRYPGADETIDFTQETTVAVALGQRPDGCWAIRVTNATQQAPGVVMVEVTTYEPNPEMFCTQVVTYPYHVVALKGAYDEVTFSERNATYGSG